MCNPILKDGAAASVDTVDASPTDAEHHAKQGRVVPQFAACMVASLGTLSAGAINGWTAGTLPSLQQDPDIHMGTTETALMASVVGIGAMLGSLIAGRVIDYLGRRTTILVSLPIVAGGWVLKALATHLYLILAARFLCGLMSAFLFSAVPVYNSEVPEARLRGRLGSMSSLFLTFGIVLSYTAGALLPWRLSCYVCAAPALLGTVALLAVPESPYWYMLKNRRSDAEASLRWLRGPHCDIKEYLDNIARKLEDVGRKMEYKELLRPRTRRPVLIALFIMALQQCSGVNILMIYTGTIFVSAGVENHQMAIVYTGLVQLLGAFSSMLLMDRMGRRLLIIISLIVAGVFTILLATYYYMQNVAGASWPHQVPVVAVVMAVFGYSFGCRTVPWLASTELFNTTIRSTANTACIFFNRMLGYIIVQIYPYAAQAVGPHTVFFVFGSFSLVFSILTPIIVPETRGKSLEQIQEYFEKKSMKNQIKKNVDYCDDQLKPEEKTCIKTKESVSPTIPQVITSKEDSLVNEMTKL